MRCYSISVPLASLLLGLSFVVQAEDGPDAVVDDRVLVEMPEQAQRNLSLDMREHLQALSAVITRMAVDDFEGAAKVAEEGLGYSSMGKFRGSPMAPGRHMPEEMKSIGRSMHAAASAFAEAAEQGDLNDAKRQLSRVTSACVGCHTSFRVR